MSSDVGIPGWAREEANSCLPGNAWNPLTVERIALALLTAEQRGRKAGLEEAAKVVRTFAIKAARAHLDAGNSKAIVRMFNEIADFLPAAIRSLGDKI